jgi:hypothetical protein
LKHPVLGTLKIRFRENFKSVQFWDNLKHPALGIGLNYNHLDPLESEKIVVID